MSLQINLKAANVHRMKEISRGQKNLEPRKPDVAGNEASEMLLKERIIRKHTVPIKPLKRCATFQ